MPSGDPRARRDLRPRPGTVWPTMVRRTGFCDTAAMDRSSLFDTYRRHVNAGKIAMFEQVGIDTVMGHRSGIRFSVIMTVNR